MHLYLKRDASDELLFGPAYRPRARAAGREGLFAAPDAAGGPVMGTGADGRRARKTTGV